MGKGKYSIELFDKICTDIATSSKGLKEICQAHNVSTVAFYDWIQGDSELLNKYTRAREAQADLLADEIIKLADDKTGDTQAGEFGDVGNAANIARSRLQVEARKWIAAKLKPKKYGDKVEVESNVNIQSLPDWLTKKIE
jgi:predicted DNA-binding protein YlxM (UPF0122 family)